MKNLRSSHNFFIVENTGSVITGQLVRDTQFSLMSSAGDIIKLAICVNKNDVIEEFVFDYEICENNESAQIFEFPDKNKTLTISFLHYRVDKKVMIYCPTFHLFH